MVYISDHGEALGENGKWLHAHNDKSLSNPAMIIWFSEEYKRKYPEKIAHFNKLILNKENTTDILYPMILDIFEIINK